MFARDRAEPERLFERAGWAKFPSCSYVTIGADSLRCAYDYDSLYERVSKALAGDTLEDMGFSNSFEDAAAMGQIRRECSVHQCPFLHGRLPQRSRPSALRRFLSNFGSVFPPQFGEPNHVNTEARENEA